ncbi:hypothetical protein PHLCEN_2v1844 [Hermanssonia centrifuga]|uniref:Uncharacterized protein n=1 Tax=Hermanssonia centrifuga TaxID=98765 RepID=A0A2R6RVR0_9APHY|nr:hypothetical protein PHLCEN_2v1844 [Hermanssonia centrifuga]
MKHVKNSKTLKKRAEGDDEEEEDNRAMMIVDSGYSSVGILNLPWSVLASGNSTWAQRYMHGARE